MDHSYEPKLNVVADSSVANDIVCVSHDNIDTPSSGDKPVSADKKRTQHADHDCVDVDLKTGKETSDRYSRTVRWHINSANQ